MYSQWRVNRISWGLVPDEIINANLDNVGELSKSDLCYALAQFIREVKKMDISEYPPNTLREIIVMIQMYLNEHSIYWKLLDEQDFVAVHNIVDNTMKEQHSKLGRCGRVVSASACQAGGL